MTFKVVNIKQVTKYIIIKTFKKEKLNRIDLPAYGGYKIVYYLNT